MKRALLLGGRNARARGAAAGAARCGRSSRAGFSSSGGNLYALDVESGRERWRVALGGGVNSTPAIEGGGFSPRVVGAGSAAVDLATGRVLWRFAGGPERPHRYGWDYWLSSPAVFRGVVYFGAGDGNVYAVDARSGAERWR